MIIDAILDRRAGSEYDVETLRYIYDEAVYFEFTELANAVWSGNEEHIKRELCAYIDENQYNPEIKDYVKSVDWLNVMNNLSTIVNNSK